MTKFLMLLACAAVATGAAAQTVYKSTAGGKVSYGERPCSEGKTTVLPTPTAGDGAAAQAAADSDKAALATLEKARAAQVREADRAARAADVQRKKCERLRLKQRWAEEDAARADGKALGAARLKAKRQGEALAVECPG